MRSGSFAKAAGRTLIATSRFSLESRALYTSPYSCAVSQRRPSFCSCKRRPTPARGAGGRSPQLRSLLPYRPKPPQAALLLAGAFTRPSAASGGVPPACPRRGKRERGRIQFLAPQANSGVPLAPVDDGRMEQFWNAHRLRYESTSPTGATVRHGLLSGDGALWSDIAYSDVVRALVSSGLHYRACAGLKPSADSQPKEWNRT